MKPNTFERRNPNRLREHPLNVEIYGDKIDEDFLEDIRRRGVQEPLQILENDLMISGHRRRRHAITAGLSEVPCVVRRDIKDDLEVRECLKLSNRLQRERTNEQIAREFKELKAIEEERAKIRQRRGQPQPGEKVGRKVCPNSDAPLKPDENGQNAKSGRSDDRAAAAVGMGRDTARKGAEVVEAIDAAESAGDTKRADELRESLNRESVNAAHKKLKISSKLIAALERIARASPKGRMDIAEGRLEVSDKDVISIGKLENDEDVATAIKNIRFGKKWDADGSGPEIDDRQNLFKDLNTFVGKVVRIINDLGCHDGQGKRASEAVDALCHAIEGWK